MKKVLITGGSSGLGKTLTEMLAKNYEVYYTYYSNSIPLKGANGIALDLKDSESITSLKEWILDAKPDILVNNAISSLAPLQAHKETKELASSSFDENVASVVELTNAFIKIARKKKEGKIINVLTSYTVGKIPLGMAKYTAEKNYLLSLSKSWAGENIKFNISSNCISPSMMETNLTADIDERNKSLIIDNHPMKRFITPEEVAHCVEFLMEASPFLTGQNIVLNGGENL